MALHLDSLRLRRLAVWGYGLEGQAALRLLRGYFPEKKIGVILDADEAAQWDFSGDPMIEVVTDPPSAGTFGQFQYIIKSPGISPYPYQRAMEWAEFRGTRFISGTSLWFGHHSRDKTVVITGTKGKSTTSALTAALLRASGARVGLAGNIGLPLLEVLNPDPPADIWVIELSSYQAADFVGHPALVAVLNLSPEHLNWHGDVDTYYRDKLKLAAPGVADLVVLNAADPTLMAQVAPLENKVLFNHRGFWHARGAEVWHDEERVVDLADTALRGEHNASNVAAAFTIVEALGVDPRKLLDALRQFPPLPHRLTPLGTRDGIDFVDDSIATTPAATLAAIRALSDRPVVTIVGGFDRGVSWQSFAASPLPNLRGLVVTGQSAERIAADLAGQASIELVRAATMDAAVDAARRIAHSGEVILLSPGAPSFDQYWNYAERGRAFARAAGLEAPGDEIAGIGVY
jgi:UDP-N-acetylmuramoylalanine--D-glutamate ligase